MILKLLELNYPLDEVVYFDIGAEFESIYQNKQRVKELSRNRDILFTELKPKQDFFYLMLEKPVTKRTGQKQLGYFLPDYWEKLKELQSKIDIPFKDRYSVFDLEKRFKKNNALFLEEEEYEWRSMFR